MAKRQSAARTGRGVLDLREQGLRAFQSGHYDQAIAAWTGLARTQPAVAAALAEAYARRSRRHTAGDAQIHDLRQALALAPGEVRYHYQLGLALHRAGDLRAAIRQYHEVLQHDAAWPGVGLVLALALLEQDEQTDLSTVPGSTPTIQAVLTPVQQLLCGNLPHPPDESPMSQLWRGLGMIRSGDPAARAVLDDRRALPHASARLIRRYYAGVAAARTGDVAGALAEWERVYQDAASVKRPHRPWLLQNLAAALIQQLTAQLDADDLDGATATAERALTMPIGNAALNALLVQALDRGAHAAARDGNWLRASQLWEGARDIVSSSVGLGSPRPLHQNLALAYESQERWTDAAEAWRAMLRTKPRKTAVGADTADARTPSPEQWAWVRKRVIECYKRAGQPDEAVVVFRQAVKADPADLDLRLQLVDALVANEQEQAAINELQRMLQVDPRHVEARMRLGALHAARGEWLAAEEILRGVLAQHPQREDVRRQLARLLLMHGQEQHRFGRLQQAVAAFTEGQQLAPNDYQFPLNLARVALDQRKPKAARELLDRTLQLAADQPAAYLQVIDCWAVADNLSEARAVLERAESALTLTPEFYISLGVQLLSRDVSPGFINPFALPQRRKPTVGPWTDFAQELLDRAVALRPEDGQLRLAIASALIRVRTDLALTYVEAGVQMLPDDPHGFMLLGLVQAMNEQKREAKKTLMRGERLARQQGDVEFATEIASMRQQIDSPFFGLTLQMGPLLDDLDDDLDVDDFFL